MDPITQQQALAAAGAGGDKVYVEDVFSTFLYAGNSTARSINNGIDLSGEGGLTWIKSRTNSYPNQLYDTERGAGKYLISESTAHEATNITRLSAFNSNGFSLGTNSNANGNGQDFVSWSFRKAPGFFDVVSYTGDGTTNRQIAHDLGSTPGMIIVKKTSSNIVNLGWYVWHRSLSSNQEILLNTNGAATSNSTFTAVTSTYFTPASSLAVNASGTTYVAYIFAHDDQSFGTNSDEAIIKCGSSSYNTFENLGFEPQWLLLRSTGGDNWYIYDNMRGLPASGSTPYLMPNHALAENTSGSNQATVTAQGFTQAIGPTILYVAIRRPHKPPTAGTDVFKALTDTHTESARSITGVGFSPDLVMNLTTNHASHANHFIDRMRGPSKYLQTNVSSTQNTATSGVTSFDHDGITLGSGSSGIGINSNTGNTSVKQFLRRAPGFFDIVSYVGTSPSSQLVNHNLNAVPELMIVKSINQPNTNFGVYHKDVGNTSTLQLNSTAQATTTPNAIYWNNTTPTSSAFTVGSTHNVNHAYTYIAYLFASLPGISKVGSFSGTGSNIDVDCGFTNGARYVLIKRTDAAPPVYGGSWYVWDTARGIVSGNDPFTELNYGGAQTTNTDYIDPLSSGFTVTSSAPAQLNASGGSYIFLAIA